MKINSKDTLKYTGSVKITVKKDKKKVKTNIYHNNGCDELFHFLALCLANKNAEADAYRPVKIKAFYIEDFKPSEIANSKQKVFLDSNAVTNYLMTNTAPTVTSENETVLHFLIPYSFVTKNKINIFALYPSLATITKPIAYFLLANETDDTWTPIEIDADTKTQLNLAIEWTLKISNKGE